MGLHNYHDTYGEFPPACIKDENGRPMHSWRVLILPFIEQQQLYDQYRFEEPWDGPNNRKLANQMPPVFRCPSYVHHKEHEHQWGEDEKVLTQYVALVGSETKFPPNQSVRGNEIADGAEHTLMVAEIHQECVHWMAPVDIVLDEFALAFFGLGENHKNHPGGTHLVLADGSVRFIPETIDREKLLALFTIDRGKSR